MVSALHTNRTVTQKTIFLCLFLLFSLSVFSQDSITRGTIRVRKTQDPHPHIAGKKGGSITAAELCSDLGIQSELPGVKIIHFVLTYYKGGEVTVEVEGNRMPENFCKALLKMSEGAPIGMERILAMDSTGRKFNLNPLRYTLNAKPIPAEKIEITPENPREVKSNFTAETAKPDIDGMYKLVAEYVNLRRTYIKLFNDSLAYIVESVDDPVVLDQFLMNRYKRETRAPGKYQYDGKTLRITFESDHWNCDFSGTYSGGGLDVKEVSRDGILSENAKKFALLPFSQKK